MLTTRQNDPPGGRGKWIEVAIGILTRADKGQTEIFIARRPQTAPLAGYWEFPGGKCESGETPVQCLVREFQEELGITIAVEQPLTVIEHRYDHGQVRLNPHFCRLIAGQPRNLAVLEHRWVQPRQLREHRFPPANDGLIEQIIARFTAD